MRLRRSRVKEFYHKSRITKKDGEGGTYVEYGDAVLFTGESWPAGGKVQAAQYGERLSYIHNVKMEGKYEIKPDTSRKNVLHYIFSETGLDLVEGDGICLFVPGDSDPDYKIISIKPYKPLRMEVEKL